MLVSIVLKQPVMMVTGCDWVPVSVYLQNVKQLHLASEPCYAYPSSRMLSALWRNRWYQWPHSLKFTNTHRHARTHTQILKKILKCYVLRLGMGIRGTQCPSLPESKCLLLPWNIWCRSGITKVMTEKHLKCIPRSHWQDDHTFYNESLCLESGCWQECVQLSYW